MAGGERKATGRTENQDPGGRPRPREVLVKSLHLAALWAVTFVQPLLDLLGSNPEFFVARGNRSSDILILALGLTLGPAFVLGAVLVLAAFLGRRAFMAAYLVLVAVLVAFFSVQILERLFGFGDLPAVFTVVAALAVGVGFSWALTRGRFFTALLDVLTVAPVVILALFVFNSGVTKLIFPEDPGKALGKSVTKETPVVMIVFDELPAATLLDRSGKIDAERFPGFANLAEQSTWFPRTTTVADFTGRAVPAILTGLLPDGRKLPIAADQPRNLFTLLGGSYAMHVRESVTSLCPESLCGQKEEGPSLRSRLRALYDDLKYVEGRLVLPDGIAANLPQVSTTFGDFGKADDGDAHKRAGKFVKDLFTPPTRAELADWIAQIPSDAGTLSVMHMELPHEPFRFLPSGRSYNETFISNLTTAGAQKWAVADPGIATAHQRHFLQTAYADRLVSTLIAQLKQLGIWQDALVVITADHGISFKEGLPRRIAVEGNLGGIVNVPLFIKLPGQRQGVTSDRHVRTIDIVPTIASVLGVKGMYKTDGVPIPLGGKRDEQGSGDTDEVEVFNGYVDVVETTIDEVIAERDEVLEATAKSLGDGGLDRLGPAPELVGLEAPSGVPSAAPETTAKLQAPGIFKDVDLEADSLPAFVAGSLTGVDPGTVIAIALNGEIAATARAFEFKDEVRFGAVVPESSLQEGENTVNLYLVDEGGRLSALATS
jgi:hypothetical protein